jgi:hypothetical protein
MISGGKITGFDAKRLKDGQATGMAVNIAIDDLKAEGNRLTASYSYAVDYQPGMAKMTIFGEIWFDEKNAKQLVEDWRKSKKFPPAMAEDLLTAINYAASAVGTLLSFGLGISAPLSISRARVQQQPANTKAS